MLPLALCFVLQTAPAPSEPVFEIETANATERIPYRTFRDWCVYWRGEAQARRYAELRTARELAPEHGVHVDAARIADALAGEIQGRVEHAFGGDVDGWRRELESLGRTERGYRTQRRAELEEELLLEGLARATRVIEEEDERAEWERLFGRDGRSYDVRAISLKLQQPSAPVGTPAEELRAMRERAREALAERAADLRGQLEAGADFDTLLAEHADDPETKDRGGRFERFPPPGWPQAGLEALDAAEPGDVLAPVFHRGSFHVVRVEGIRTTSFEEARPEVLQSLEDRPIDATEMMSARAQVALATDVEFLPALYVPDGPGDAVVMRVNGEDVTRSELGAWTVRVLGERDAPVFALVHSVASECRERGLMPTPEEVEARIRRDIELQIEHAFNGDRDRWLQSLAPRYMTLDAFVAGMTPVTEHHMQAEALIQADRVVGDDEVVRAFEQRYGPNGRRIEARWIRFSVPVTNEMSADELEAAQQETRAEAAKVRQRLAAGVDFATLARRHSTDPRTKDAGGSPDGPWVADRWSQPVRSAVEALTTGGLSEPIVDRQYVWIFQVLSDRRIAFEDVEDELRAELENRRPSDPERAAWLNVRSRTYELRLLDALYRE